MDEVRTGASRRAGNTPVVTKSSSPTRGIKRQQDCQKIGWHICLWKIQIVTYPGARGGTQWPQKVLFVSRTRQLGFQIRQGWWAGSKDARPQGWGTYLLSPRTGASRKNSEDPMVEKSLTPRKERNSREGVGGQASSSWGGVRRKRTSPSVGKPREFQRSNQGIFHASATGADLGLDNESQGHTSGPRGATADRFIPESGTEALCNEGFSGIALQLVSIQAWESAGSGWFFFSSKGAWLGERENTTFS